MAKNEAAQQTTLNHLIGLTYLGANDPNLVLRTWQAVMDEFSQRGQEHTRTRRQRAMRFLAFAGLGSKRLVETTADDLRKVMTLGGTSLNHFLFNVLFLPLHGWFLFPCLKKAFHIFLATLNTPDFLKISFILLRCKNTSAT